MHCAALWCAGRNGSTEYVVSGGGANNPTLLAMLANELGPLGLKIRSSDEFGLPSEAKEAAAFALMAFETWNRRAVECAVRHRSPAARDFGEDLVCVSGGGRLDSRSLDSFRRASAPAPSLGMTGLLRIAADTGLLWSCLAFALLLLGQA